MLDQITLSNWAGVGITVALNVGALAVAWGRTQQRLSNLETVVSDLRTDITNHLHTMDEKVVQTVKDAIAEYSTHAELDRSKERIKDLEEQVAKLHGRK